MKLSRIIYSGLLALTILATTARPAGRVAVLGGEGDYVGNLHTHTLASDGKDSYRRMITEAEEIGLDFLVITDHSRISQATRNYCPYEKDILCIPGEEISSNEGHILAIDIREAIPGGLSAQETIDRIHEQGGVAIVAHLQYGMSRSNLKRLEGVDAIEYTPWIDCTSKWGCKYERVYDQEWYWNLVPIEGYPLVFNSDAHNTEMLSNAANKCSLEELSAEGLKKAIRKGDCGVYFP